MKKLILLAAFVVASMGLLHAGEKITRAVGEGATYRAAVNAALVTALEQETGLTISSSERQKITESDAFVSTRVNGATDDRGTLEMNDAIAKETEKWAKGKILGFTVVSETINGDKRRVEVDVRFPGTHVVGLAPDNRRRMAVTTFRSLRANYAWHGKTLGATEWAMALGDKLNIVLTQSRKFTMLDRKFDTEVNAELARLSGTNAAAADVVRLNQKLGTDYLVVGEIAFNDVSAPGVNPFTGRTLPATSSLFVEVTYRVLLAPTGQLKWTDVVRLDAASFASADALTFVSRTTEAAASTIAEGLMRAILPLEVVAVTKSGQVVIGEGGKAVRVGDRYTVYAEGEEVTDTRTGEVIDVVEEPVGTVEVTRVTEKLSYARPVEGDVSAMVVGSRLRPAPVVVPPVTAPVVPAPTTQTITTPAGGVVLPF